MKPFPRDRVFPGTGPLFPEVQAWEGASAFLLFPLTGVTTGQKCSRPVMLGIEPSCRILAFRVGKLEAVCSVNTGRESCPPGVCGPQREQADPTLVCLGVYKVIPHLFPNPFAKSNFVSLGKTH